MSEKYWMAMHESVDHEPDSKTCEKIEGYDMKRWICTGCVVFLCTAAVGIGQTTSGNETHGLRAVPIQAVKIDDGFWSPKFDVWSRVTVQDVLDKFEKTGAFRNFDRVAGVLPGKHEGPPWYDGLVYETIRGAADLLISRPSPDLEKRIDGIIERIAAAQAKDPTGYVMTYTQLEEPGHQWGLNGGYERWQHDVYNTGALVEAGVHTYRATGKTRLLTVAVRMANLMCDTMGPSPRKNVVPSHPLPEEAFVELYGLFRDTPSLWEKVGVPVDEKRYLELAEFWLENRGNNCGRPTTQQWEKEEPASQKWVRDQKYGDSRPSWGAYAQDDKPIFQQDTLEGHAVRATLLCAGLVAAAGVNGQPEYVQAANRLWDNMVGRRMHITGGVGAFAHEEKFGPDYVLPNDAYLETCAAVGAGFFHRNMNLLFGRARYVDELERTLYNNVLNGVSLEGNRYYYQNPISANANHRWQWHDCPCCPPMFLKIVSAIPGYIYAQDDSGLYVNLFIGSRAEVSINNISLTIAQKTNYPWQGGVSLVLEPQQPKDFSVYVRIPGWAQGKENPFGLYRSDFQAPSISFKLNGNDVSPSAILRGYAVFTRTWSKGDRIEFELPIQPRRIYAHAEVAADRGRVALESGPIVYCIEQKDNPKMNSVFLKPDSAVHLAFRPDLFGGVNVITGEASSLRQDRSPDTVLFTAIPFYCQDNRPGDGRLEVWLPETPELVKPLPVPTMANQAKASASHCFDRDTIAAINDGVEPVHSNDHSIPRQTWWDHKGTTEWAQYDFDALKRVSSSAVYWWDDRPAGGGCAVPAAWRLLYQEKGQWKPIPGANNYGTGKDQFNEVAFPAVETTAVRLEVILQKGFSGGILEWKVK
jgi:DUF1680 family protein